MNRFESILQILLNLVTLIFQEATQQYFKQDQSQPSQQQHQQKQLEQNRQFLDSLSTKLTISAENPNQRISQIYAKKNPTEDPKNPK